MADQETLVARGPNLVRWGAVFSGAISAVALFALFSALWIALAYDAVATGGNLDIRSSGTADNLEWLLAGSAVVAMLIGGFITGWFAGLRGGGVGALNGFIAWGVTLFATIVFGAPSVLGSLGFASAGGGPVGATTFGLGELWAPFWSLLVGLGVAVIGGAIGGVVPRPRWIFQPQAMEITELVSEPMGRTTMRAHMVDLRGSERVPPRAETRTETGGMVR